MRSWTRQNIELLEYLARRAATATFDRAIRAYRLSRKYSPDQPRMPAGSREGGQWTSGGAYLNVAASQSPAYCWNQMLIDMMYCSTLQKVSRRAACRSQANERYAACLAGRPLPPLPFLEPPL
jgi:hypothetical protein